MYQRRWGSDRRRFQRLSVNLSVFYKVDSPVYVRVIVGDEEIEATTLDISGGGMAFLTKHNIPPWSVLLMKFILFKLDKEGLVSFNDPVEVSAEVRSNIIFNKEYRLGVCFKEIKKEDEGEISSFIESTSRSA